MHVLKLIIGILLVLISIVYFIYKINLDSREESDDMLFSFRIKIYVGLLAIFIVGIIMIYREIKFLL